MDYPVIHPVNDVYDERSQSVAFRTADGSKFHAMLSSGTGAFESMRSTPARALAGA
jgi:hypothetical protein